MKRMLSTGLVAGLMLTLVGCGGGGDSTPTGTAYYVDSGVEGLKYTCGSETGTTGADGAFTFELGEGCTFYLGDIELREVEARFLHNGKKYVETDYSIDTLLQSLDSSGSLADGIQIKADVLANLKEEGLETLEDMLNKMDDVWSALGIDPLDEKGVQEHVLTSLLAGNTYYTTSQDDQGNYEISSLLFAKDMESITEGEGEAITLVLNGEEITVGDKVYIVAEVEPEYILVDVKSGGKFIGEKRLFLDKKGAEDYVQTKTSENGGHTDVKIDVTEDMISGKTLYHAGVESTKGIKIYRKFTFNADENNRSKGTVDLHLGLLMSTGMVKYKNPKLPYILTEGKIRIDTSAFYKKSDGHSEYFIFTLQSNSNGKWYLKKEVDKGQDGTIDGTFYPAWHISKPNNFIEK